MQIEILQLLLVLLVCVLLVAGGNWHLSKYVCVYACRVLVIKKVKEFINKMNFPRSSIFVFLQSYSVLDALAGVDVRIGRTYAKFQPDLLKVRYSVLRSVRERYRFFDVWRYRSGPGSWRSLGHTTF